MTWNAEEEIERFKQTLEYRIEVAHEELRNAIYEQRDSDAKYWHNKWRLLRTQRVD